MFGKNNFTNKQLDIDAVVSLLTEGEVGQYEYNRIQQYIKKLDSQELAELDFKVKENMHTIQERLEKRRLKIAERVKSQYENTMKKIFNDIGSVALGEIYETSQCLDLELKSGVYFLRNLDNGLLKIGYGKNLVRRIRQIQSAFNLIGYDENLKLIAIHLCFEPHLGITELFFHNEFKEKKVKGEWFDISDNELTDFFLCTDYQGDYIDEVLVSWADYESVYFEPLEKDFNIDIREMEYEIFKDVLMASNFEKLFRCGVRNKLYRIAKAVDEHKVAIIAFDFKHFPDIKRHGITARGATESFDFLGLKASKFDYQETKKSINKIQKSLARNKG